MTVSPLVIETLLKLISAPLVPTVQDLNVYVVGSNVDNAVADPNTGGLPDLTQIGLTQAN